MENRNRSIYVRVNEKEKAKICFNADFTGLSISEFIRKVALGYSPKPKSSDNFFGIMNLIYEIYEDVQGVLDEKTKEDLIEKIRFLEENYLLPEKERG